MANHAFWTMTILGEETVLQSIKHRISTGLMDSWTSDGFDIPCFLRREHWGNLIQVTEGEESWVWITPETEVSLARKENNGLIIRGLSKWAPPLDWFERITAIFPVTIESHSRTEYECYEDWHHVAGWSHRTGGGDFEPWALTEKPWMGGDPLIAKHHEACELDPNELLRLQNASVMPKLLPLKQVDKADQVAWA